MMTRDDVAQELAAMSPGKAAGITYEFYAELWPPGEPNQEARGDSFAFAEENGCRIENNTDDQSVWFVKDA